MATAVAERPASDTGQAGDAKSDPTNLWNGQEIEVICGTGEYSSGKTLFGLTIDPGPRTLVYDNEGSSVTYKRSLGFKHIDMAAELIRKHSRPGKPIERWLWWKDHSLEQGKNGKFTVCMVDPFSEIEAGLADWVYENPAAFGKTKAQFDKSSGLYWGCVKDHLKGHLDSLRAYFDTVYLVVHMRDEWKGSAPTGKREPKGKETLFELASLYLKFERIADKKGVVPSVPAATVLKSRLANIRITETGEVESFPVLPPRMPKATPKAIRDYIIDPPNYDKLKAEERLREEVLSDDERLRLQAMIAENNREAAQAELAKVDRAKEAADAQARAAAARPQASDQSAARAESQVAKTAAAAAANGQSQAEPIKSGTLAEIVAMAKVLWADRGEYSQYLYNNFGVQKTDELSQDQAETALAYLYDRKAANAGERAAESLKKVEEIRQREDADKERQAAADDAELAAAGDPPVQPVEAPAPERCSQEQYDAMRMLAKGLYYTPSAMREILAERYQVASSNELTAEQGADLIAWMEREIANRPQPTAESIENPTGSITKEQLDRLRKLCEQCGWGREKQAEYLASMKVGNFRSLTVEQANALIDKLLSVQLGFSADIESPPGN